MYAPFPLLPPAPTQHKTALSSRTMEHSQHTSAQSSHADALQPRIDAVTEGTSALTVTEGENRNNPVEYQIPPPPQQEYHSEAEAEAALHAWTLQHKFCVTKKAVKCNDNKEPVYRLFACDRSGKLKNTHNLREEDRVRTARRSMRASCPMRISLVPANVNNPHGPWKIKYTKDGSRIHYHPPSQDCSVHVTHRQREAERTAFIETNCLNDLIFAHQAAGIATSKTYGALLHTNKNTLTIPKDISNKKAAHRRKLLASRTPVEALFAALDDANFLYYYETEESCNRLRYLLWAHPDTLTLARDYLDILVLDCTYKTNKYDYPLLNIITITGMNNILPIAQCWLPGVLEPSEHPMKRASV